MPPKSPCTASAITRPPMIMLRSAEPLDSLGGAAGSCQKRAVKSHLPASEDSHWCCLPGVAAFIIASIIAFSSADIGFSWGSAARAGSASRASAARSAIHLQILLVIFTIAVSLVGSSALYPRRRGAWICYPWAPIRGDPSPKSLRCDERRIRSPQAGPHLRRRAGRPGPVRGPPGAGGPALPAVPRHHAEH